MLMWHLRSQDEPVSVRDRVCRTTNWGEREESAYGVNGSIEYET